MGYFRLRKIFFPRLGLKGIYHYWKYFVIFSGVLAKCKVIRVVPSLASLFEGKDSSGALRWNCHRLHVRRGPLSKLSAIGTGETWRRSSKSWRLQGWGGWRGCSGSDALTSLNLAGETLGQGVSGNL